MNKAAQGQCGKPGICPWSLGTQTWTASWQDEPTSCRIQGYLSRDFYLEWVLMAMRDEKGWYLMARLRWNSTKVKMCCVCICEYSPGQWGEKKCAFRRRTTKLWIWTWAEIPRHLSQGGCGSSLVWRPCINLVGGSYLTRGHQVPSKPMATTFHSIRPITGVLP